MCDWDAMRAEYIATSCRYADIAAKYGVPPGTVGSRASQEHWPELRKKAKKAAQKKVAESIGRQQGKDLAQMIRATESFATSLEGLLEAISDNPEGLLADLRGVESIAGALRKTTDNLRELYGIPTQAQRLARERLEIERERWKAEKAAAAQDSDHGRVEVRWIIPEEKQAREDVDG